MNDKACSLGDVRIDIRRFDAVTSVMDAHFLGFRDAVFDKIVCFEVLEHLESPFRVLREFKRVLKHDGKILLSVPNLWYWRRIVRTRIPKSMADPPTEEYHKQGWDVHEFYSLAHSAGLEVTRTRWLNWYDEKRRFALLDLPFRFLPQISFVHVLFELKVIEETRIIPVNRSICFSIRSQLR